MTHHCEHTRAGNVARVACGRWEWLTLVLPDQNRNIDQVFTSAVIIECVYGHNKVVVNMRASIVE